MQNKHKIWIICLGIFLLAVAIVGFASTEVPSLVITDPNSTSNSSNSVSHSVSTGKVNGTQNLQQTTPPITQPTPMKQCTKCGGTGEITCTKCNGVFKWKECPNCHDIVPYPSYYTGCGCTLNKFGYYTNYVVKTCECGDGKVTCPKCNGATQVPA
ncbi:MAG: hypothetical protein HZC47_06270 [Methanobacterium sp.]|uniref:hypothetical protein n=1 Tax=Methanobacterium sp. TaxID=2164 RepID=UPI003D6518D9|nr:hypothetical protein [Methanobacterium sp.]